MPRPTNAQVAYGLPTVVLFTFAVLLLTGARSGVAVVAVAAGGMALGLLVAAGVAARRRPAMAPAAPAHSATGRAPAGQRGCLAPPPRTRLRGGHAEHRVGEHSLRR